MFSLKRDDLLSILQRLNAIVSTQQTMPVLSYAEFDMDQDQLKITCSDLELRLVGLLTLDSPVDKPCKLLLPVRKLFDICRALPEGSVLNFSDKGAKVSITCGRSRFMLSTFPHDEFPKDSVHDGEQWEVRTTQKSFMTLLKSTCFAMGAQDVRYYLNGLLLELHANSLCAVATDGHRLALNRMAAKTTTDHKVQIIIPNKSVNELMRLLSPVDSEAVLTVSASQLRYANATFVFTTKLIDARFPNYECALPIGLDKIITLHRESFKQMLVRVAICCNDKLKAVQLELRSGKVKIMAFNKAQETADEDFTVDYTGPDLDIAFNVTYLLEVIQGCSADYIEMSFKDAATSILIKEAGIDSQAMFVLMPLCLYQNADSEYSYN